MPSSVKQQQQINKMIVLSCSDSAFLNIKNKQASGGWYAKISFKQR